MMTKDKFIKLLGVAPLVLSTTLGYSITPSEHNLLAKKLNKESSKYVLRSEHRNAKGTILESIAGSYSTPDYWFNLDPMIDGVQGVSADRVYKEFGIAKTNEDIIVAVIDSGVDVNHEDLQGKIWINTDEIAGNGIDDDNNGYIDDIFGWNFIGNKEGMAKIIKTNELKNKYKLIKGDPTKQVSADNLEVTREYARLLKLKKELAAVGEYLTPEDEALLTEVQTEVESERMKALNSLSFYQGNYELYMDSEKTLLNEGGLTEITYEAVEDLKPASLEVLNARKSMLSLLNKGYDKASLISEIEYYNIQANYYYNKNADTRSEIVKDDYSNQTESNYGNNDVIGPDSFHGTHVAGIIAADRDNGIGIKGIASKVKIMALRAVPNGDERDKDIANSIRYAVDNGAKIINMSFGKSYSPYKSVVDEAVKYAEEKGVLLVHAAGNSNKDNDLGKNFPNRNLTADQVEAANWLEIGASSYKEGSSFAASFSNYGDHSVDIFAPGVNLYSTIPDNKYSDASGTSMASPATAGVAALVLSYKPELTAVELKDILISTSNRYPNLKVYKSKLGYIQFSDLSIHGGTPNAYEAVKVVLKQKTPVKQGFFGRLLSRLRNRKR